MGRLICYWFDVLRNHVFFLEENMRSLIGFSCFSCYLLKFWYQIQLNCLINPKREDWKTVILLIYPDSILECLWKHKKEQQAI